MDEQDLLRYQEEPFEHFNEMQIHEALMKHVNEFMDMLERFYFAWQIQQNIVEQPKKQIFTTKGLKGDLRVMPCLIDEFENKLIKAVKIIGTNEEEKYIKDKICVGKSLLVDTSDNFVKGIFDVCALSSFRTAAISVAAFKQTININGQKIGILGLGRIGFYTSIILSRWLGIKELRVCDINKDRVKQFIGLLGKKIKIKKVSFEELCHSCSSVFLSTTSKNPLLNDRNSKNFQFISSVGADAENLSELDYTLLKNRKVISESRQNVSFGDLRKWHQKGLLKEEQVIELREIVGCFDRGKHFVLFISTGTAIQDALICQFLFEKLSKKKI